MGEKVLPVVIPTLVKSMESEVPATRQGVCYGLKEVLEAMTREQLAANLTEMMPAVQTALCDTDDEARPLLTLSFCLTRFSMSFLSPLL